ncbi:uncharacterized protein LOC128987150 [Macrosteles quadrilineatus]|uniref:uncharacterized protein LOC128987150 n=1 Tax=Macrosteles quadrilineatus TaxID=74068 RepID=UPI0023E1DE97|nr:uncharacterized protein LOC128987150 [Macrosteles quadrilineatus]
MLLLANLLTLCFILPILVPGAEADEVGGGFGDDYVEGLVPSVELLLEGIVTSLLGTPLSLLTSLVSGDGNVPSLLDLVKSIISGIIESLSNSLYGITDTLSEPLEL